MKKGDNRDIVNKKQVFVFKPSYRCAISANQIQSTERCFWPKKDVNKHKVMTRSTCFTGITLIVSKSNVFSIAKLN